MIQFVYESKEGKVYHTTGAPKENIEEVLGRTLLDEEYRDIILKSVNHLIADPDKVIEVTSQDQLPDDDLFPCWEIDGKKVKLNFDKVKEWGVARLRGLRKPMLDVLDLEAARALEDGNHEAFEKIINKKRQLRNITEEMKSLTCPNGKFACQTTLRRFRELIDKSRLEGILNGEADK